MHTVLYHPLIKTSVIIWEKLTTLQTLIIFKYICIVFTFDWVKYIQSVNYLKYLFYKNEM